MPHLVVDDVNNPFVLDPAVVLALDPWRFGDPSSSHDEVIVAVRIANG